uniref:Uncharacterized protein n=1 Tax=Clytia hemisphaerica TaxID=252671 RepID=A0A7M5WZK5_9CNID
MHEICRQQFKIASTISTYLATYHGRKIQDSFIDLGSYYEEYVKEKKKAINLYLYVDTPYMKIGFKWALEQNKSSDDDNDDTYQSGSSSTLIICPICHCTSPPNTECVRCVQNGELEESLAADQVSIP